MKTKFLLIFSIAILFFLFNLFPVSASVVVINEIMYNPPGNDNNNEYIEVYSDEWINLTGWVVGDSASNDTLVSLKYSESLYALIVEEGFNYSGLDASVYSAGAAIGNNLNNDADIISLYNQNQELIKIRTYNDSLGADGDGDSLQLCNGTFIASSPTPGAQNNCTQEKEKSIELNYPSEVQCNENFTIKVNAYNLEDGIYDVKIDIKDSVTGNRIGKVWDGTKWISTNYYINGILEILSSSGESGLIFKIEDFSGKAYFNLSIRDVGVFNGPYNFDVTCSSLDQEESEIEIADAPDNAKFGETIEIEMNIYKGDTAKYAVYIYVNDGNNRKVSETVTLHLNEKFKHYTKTIELELKHKNESGIYFIIVEGLDAEDSRQISLSSCSEHDSIDGITIGDFNYRLIIPNSVYTDKEFDVKVKIINQGNAKQEFLIWSYIYRGNKCYSCSNNKSRDSNAKKTAIESGSFAEIMLSNIVEEADDGDYKLKIKILQDGLKTPKEFTYDIKIESSEPSGETSQNSSAENSDNSGQFNQDYTDYGIMESKNTQISKMLPYFLASLCMFLAIYIIIKKI